MRAVVQRSASSSVSVEGEIKAYINRGLTVLLGIKKGDSAKEIEYIADKIINLRVFPDDQGKMNLSLQDVGGELLLVSQFTLYGDARKGRRPAFTDAEDSAKAQELFTDMVSLLTNRGIAVKTGVFGADMQVNIVNDGPVTILLDSEKMF